MAVSMSTGTLEAALVFGDGDTGENENNISLFPHVSVFGGPEVEEMVKFTDMFDKFFDSLNSRNCSASYQGRGNSISPPMGDKLDEKY